MTVVLAFLALLVAAGRPAGAVEPPPEPEYDSCIARALYLTSDGDVVQSEHVFEIVGEPR